MKMTSTALDNLVNIGKLKRESGDQIEFDGPASKSWGCALVEPVLAEGSGNHAIKNRMERYRIVE